MTAYNVTEMAGRPVVGACLVGAIVQAGGGLSNVRTSQSSVPWTSPGTHLFETAPEPNHWTPAPVVAHSTSETSPGGTTIPAERHGKQRHCFVAPRLQPPSEAARVSQRSTFTPSERLEFEVP